MVDKLNTAVDPSPPTVTITAAPDIGHHGDGCNVRLHGECRRHERACACSTEDPIELCVGPKTYTGLEPGVHTFTVIAGSTAGNFVSDTHTWTILPPGEDTMITPLTPVRFADTRTGWVAADGLFFGMVRCPPAASSRSRLRGVVVCRSVRRRWLLNVTLVGAAGRGYATVFPCGTLPGTSSVNYLAGEDGGQ